MTDNKGSGTRKWADDAEETLNKIGQALRAAWEESHQARTATLQSAKEATSRLGDAIDQGIAAARKQWEPSESETSSDHGDNPPEDGSSSDQGDASSGEEE